MGCRIAQKQIESVASTPITPEQAAAIEEVIKSKPIPRAEKVNEIVKSEIIRKQEVLQGKPVDSCIADIMAQAEDPSIKILLKPDKVQISKTDLYKFDKLAWAYTKHLKDNNIIPMWHKGDFYFYTGTHYKEVRDIEERVRTFFRQSGIPRSNNVIGNVVPNIKNNCYTHTEGDLPFFMGNEPWPKEVIAFNNGLLDVQKSCRRSLLAPPYAKMGKHCVPSLRFRPTGTMPNVVEFFKQGI